MNVRMLVRAIALASACAATTAAIGQAPAPIRIGAFLSVTGPAAFLGDPEQKTLEMYVERINAGQSPVEQIFQLDALDRRALYISRSIGDGGAIDREHYQASFPGHAFDDEHGPRIARLVAAGLVSDDGNRISLTETGKLLHDRVTLGFYPQRALDQLAGKAARIDDKIQRDTRRFAAP